jgi:dTDP-4-amino-4,6-dideoxygalactose transaminase
MLRNYGSSRKYHHEEMGVNSRLDEVQAAVLSAKLQRLAADNARRRAIAARYLEGLDGAAVRLPAVAEGAEPVWHLFVVRQRRRDALAEELARQGIETLIHYPVAPHRSGAYRDLPVDHEQVRVAERLADEVLSLPMGPHLTDAQVDEVVAATREAAEAVAP